MNSSSSKKYSERTYRRIIDGSGLVSCEVAVKETDLHILSSEDVQKQAFDLVCTFRSHIESHIVDNPLFVETLHPLPMDPLAPPIVKKMMLAAEIAGVGPMAAVAGAIAEFVGLELLRKGVREVIIENGGDIFLFRAVDCTVAIFAGSSPLSNKIGIRIPATGSPVGICTSSGTVGHSLSFGTADSVTIIAQSACVADALATRFGNEVKKASDIQPTLSLVKNIKEILGAVIIKGSRVGACGMVELVEAGGK